MYRSASSPNIRSLVWSDSLRFTNTHPLASCFSSFFKKRKILFNNFPLRTVSVDLLMILNRTPFKSFNLQGFGLPCDNLFLMCLFPKQTNSQNDPALPILADQAD